MTTKTVEDLETIRSKIEKLMAKLDNLSDHQEANKNRIVSARNNLGDASADLYDIVNNDGGY